MFAFAPLFVALVAQEATSPTATAPDAISTLIAVLPVTAESVPLDELIFIQSVLRDTVGSTGAALQPEIETNAHLAAAMKLGAACHAATPECMTRVGLLADVGHVLAATAKQRGDGVLLELHMVDVASGQQISGVADLIEGDRDARRARIVEDVLLALRPSKGQGSVLVDVQVADARILIDDADFGLSPRREPIALLPGPHVVTATKSGFSPSTATVIVRAGQRNLVELAPKEIPGVEPPPRPKDLVDRANRLGGIAAGTGLAVCGTVGGVVALLPCAAYFLTGAILDQQQVYYAPDGKYRIGDSFVDPLNSPEAVATVGLGHFVALVSSFVSTPLGVLTALSAIVGGGFVLASATADDTEILASKVRAATSERETAE